MKIKIELVSAILSLVLLFFQYFWYLSSTIYITKAIQIFQIGNIAQCSRVKLIFEDLLQAEIRCF